MEELLELLKELRGNKNTKEEMKKLRKENKFDEAVAKILDEDVCEAAIVCSNKGIVTMIGSLSEALSLLTAIMEAFLKNGIKKEHLKEALDLAVGVYGDEKYAEKEIEKLKKETKKHIEDLLEKM